MFGGGLVGGQIPYRYRLQVEPEPDRIVHGEPWIRQQPDLDPAKPDPDPDVAGSRSGKTGSSSGFCRIQFGILPDLDLDARYKN